MTEKEDRASLMEALILKTTTKQKVYENTKITFTILKKVLKKLEEDYLAVVKDKIPDTVLPAFKDRGPFEVEFRILPQIRYSDDVAFLRLSKGNI